VRSVAGPDGGQSHRVPRAGTGTSQVYNARVTTGHVHHYEPPVAILR